MTYPKTITQDSSDRSTKTNSLFTMNIGRWYLYIVRWHVGPGWLGLGRGRGANVTLATPCGRAPVSDGDGAAFIELLMKLIKVEVINGYVLK